MIGVREQIVRKVPVIGTKKGKSGQVENWGAVEWRLRCIKITAISLPRISHRKHSRSYSVSLIPTLYYHGCFPTGSLGLTTFTFEYARFVIYQSYFQMGMS